MEEPRADAGHRRLASTKFLVPPVPGCYVARPRLREALDRGAEVPVTTVVGAPGSGKTIAVASWLANRADDGTMWMSCDERDTDAPTFWRGVTEGLHRRWPDRWMDVRDLLDEDRPSLGDVAVATVNELDRLGEPVTIVLDDFQVAADAGPSVAVLVEALPPPVRVVLVSRADPSLPLHRMRVRQQLLEVRDDDLRLSAEETDALAAALGLALDPEVSSLLYERTHGWMAAVHLAAMSLRDRPDTRALLQQFSGEHRLMAEFLLGEVLNRQPLHVQRFLEDSSVLDELDFGACRAVTGVADSAELIRDLSTQNTMIVPSGDGYAFQYHQLFRELLQYRLRVNSPERYAVLHEVAAKWYAAHSEFDRAVAHFATAGNRQAAYGLLHDHAYDMLLRGGPSALDRVVSTLDLHDASEEPRRALDVALALAVAGAVEAAEHWIQRLDRAGASLSATDSARLGAVRGLVAILQGDPVACEAALAGVLTGGVHDPAVAGSTVIALLARLWLDDPAGARAVHRTAVQRPDLTLETGEVMLASALAWAAGAEGQLAESERLAVNALENAERHGMADHPTVAGALIGRGLVFHERGRFEEAEVDFERAVLLSERSRPPFVLFGCVGLARLYIAQGRVIEAAAALEFARAAMSPGGRGPLHDFVTACEARLALTAGDVERADALARTLRPSPRRTRLEATLALARRHPDAALAGLETLRPATLREMLDTTVLRTRALHALRSGDAEAALDESISCARREGFVVALVDGMPELGARVSFHLRSGPIGVFERAVLDRLDRPRSAPTRRETSQPVEQLTAREMTILRYLDSRLTANEIATECYVSPNTVRTHVKAVYRKLGSSSRREALAEARRRQLI